VCPALLAPDADQIEPRPVSPLGVDAITDGLVSQLAMGGTFVLLDLEPVVGIHVAARLNQLRLANAVLVLPRWPYQDAILPVEGLLHALITQSGQLPPEERMPNAVFVVDAGRSKPVRGRSKSDHRADNRYRLSVSDLPNLAALRKHGIRRVVHISSA
jgi:hypothetical protein